MTQLELGFKNLNGPFGAQDKKTGYDNTIISYLNFLFGASVGKDKINLLLIISYCSFVILILSFWWVTNLIRKFRFIFSFSPTPRHRMYHSPSFNNHYLSHIYNQWIYVLTIGVFLLNGFNFLFSVIEKHYSIHWLYSIDFLLLFWPSVIKELENCNLNPDQ